MSDPRQSPSGKELEVDSDDVVNRSQVPGDTLSDALDGVFSPTTVVESLGQTLVAPFNGTLLPAGHPPGLYIIAQDSLLTSGNFSSGNISRTIGYSTPGFGATSMVSVIGVAGAGPHVGGTNSAETAIMSDGTAPITYAAVPGGIVGAGSIDYYFSITLAAVEDA